MTKYYSLKEIDKAEATYNLIIGERSNGKTYAATSRCIERFLEKREQFAYVRRYSEDIVSKRASQLFAGHVANGLISELSDGKYTDVHYYSGKFYLCTRDENGKAIYNDDDCFGYTFAISSSEHYKSTSFPHIKTIVFDEFLTAGVYLPDEFVYFMNIVSTIIRRRRDVKIYMLANTVNKYAPYFTEMGLTNIQKQPQGTIEVYQYGDTKLKVAVEYCAPTQVKSKESNSHYFAFNNPKLAMITGGAWELSIYPHLPYRYKPKEVLLKFFIQYFENLFECEVINTRETAFIFIHRKTTPIKEPEKHLIYQLEINPAMNYNRSIFKPASKLQQKILWFFQHDMVFYQDNDVGDTIANYLKESRRL